MTGTIVSNVPGMENTHWDTNDPDTIERAKSQWNIGRSLGLMFYDNMTLSDLTASEKSMGFSPETSPKHTVIFAPYAGG